MSFLKDIWFDLKEKTLWPFALFLLIGILVVPMYLAKPGESTIAPTLPAKIAEEQVGPELALTRAVKTGFERAPRVNTARLDPFGRRTKAKVVKTAAALNSGADNVISSDSGSGDTGAPITSPATDPGTATDPAEPDPTPKVETEEDDLLSVIFTDDDAPTAEPISMNEIRTLSPLPDADAPFLVYIGKADADRATFLVSSGVTVSGDGECSPSITDCRTLTMTIGQTAHFVLVNDGSKKISMTMTDLETARVPVTGTEAAVKAAKLEQQGRVVGAKALKSVLKDETIVETLMRQHIKIRS